VNANEVYESEGGTMSIYKLIYDSPDAAKNQEVKIEELKVELVTVLLGRLICPALFNNNKLFYIQAQEIEDSSDPSNKNKNDETRAYTYTFTLFDLKSLKVEKS
jgi:hypothetical protein